MRTSSLPFTCFVAGAVAALGFFVGNGCGGTKGGSGFDTGDNTDGTNGEGGTGFGGSGRDDAGIDCKVSGTVAGTAYAPNGTLPLYNVIVYAPTQALDPLTDGVSCDSCGTVSGKPAATTVSDASGHFELKGVPAGDNVPIVFQVGKWRREVTVPHVDSGCATTTLTDPNMTRLPKNHTEGDIPHIAVTTGSCDDIACVLPKMGIDASEFGIQPDYADKRIIMYQGSGPSTKAGITKAQNLWGDPAEISKYDVAIFSCECDEHNETKSPADETVVSDYLDKGGRTFGTDFMYTWIHHGTESGAGSPPAPISNIMQGFVGGAPGDESTLYNVDTSFPKGQALSDWLQAVGGSTTAGKVELDDVYANFQNADPTLAQRWVYGDTDKAISFTTPFSAPEDQRCGKSYFMDVHVGSGDTVDESFPGGCSSELTPQEKMMVFFLFDLASCIQDDTKPVNPPR